MGRAKVKQYRPHLLVAFVLVIVASGGLHFGIRNQLTDLRFGSTPRAASGEIVLVAIDPRSIASIGVWPWPRTLHAQLIDRLRGAGVGDIVFDVDVSTPSNPAGDAAFAEALKSAGGSVVLPSFRQPTTTPNGQPGSLHVNRPLPAFLAQSWSAVVNVAVEPDGRVRRYPVSDRVDGQLVPSMAAIVAGQADLAKPPFLIDFGIRAASVPVVSYVDVLHGEAEALRAVNGKKVIIGGTALELGDRFSVPNGAVISGPLLQVLAAESLVQGRALSFSSSIVTLAGLLVIAAIMMLVWRRTSAGYRVSMLVGMAGAIEAGAASAKPIPDRARHLVVPAGNRCLSGGDRTRRDRLSRSSCPGRREALPACHHGARRRRHVRRLPSDDHHVESRCRSDLRLHRTRGHRPTGGHAYLSRRGAGSAVVPDYGEPAIDHAGGRRMGARTRRTPQER